MPICAPVGGRPGAVMNGHNTPAWSEVIRHVETGADAGDQPRPRARPPRRGTWRNSRPGLTPTAHPPAGPPAARSMPGVGQQLRDAAPPPTPTAPGSAGPRPCPGPRPRRPLPRWPDGPGGGPEAGAGAGGGLGLGPRAVDPVGVPHRVRGAGFAGPGAGALWSGGRPGAGERVRRPRVAGMGQSPRRVRDSPRGTTDAANARSWARSRRCGANPARRIAVSSRRPNSPTGAVFGTVTVATA